MLLKEIVGAQQQRLRDRHTKPLRSLQVDDQLDLRGLLDRQIRSFTPLRNLATKTAAYS
jgi:hypothetical protein